MTPNYHNRPDLSLTDLITRANRLHDTLIQRLSALERVEMQSGLQMCLRMQNEGARRIGLVGWIATWKGIK